jgi:hypothetical protein
VDDEESEGGVAVEECEGGQEDGDGDLCVWGGFVRTCACVVCASNKGKRKRKRGGSTAASPAAAAAPTGPASPTTHTTKRASAAAAAAAALAPDQTPCIQAGKRKRQDVDIGAGGGSGGGGDGTATPAAAALPSAAAAAAAAQTSAGAGPGPSSALALAPPTEPTHATERAKLLQVLEQYRKAGANTRGLNPCTVLAQRRHFWGSRWLASV